MSPFPNLCLLRMVPSVGLRDVGPAGGGGGGDAWSHDRVVSDVKANGRAGTVHLRWLYQTKQCFLRPPYSASSAILNESVPLLAGLR